jgi:hypothetical protein
MARKPNGAASPSLPQPPPAGPVPLLSGTGRGTLEPDGLVAVRKGDTVLRIHPSTLAQHRRLGWVPVN